MVKRALLIAFQFPPMSGTSGTQRTLRFAQHLREFRWEPVVLTAHPRAYPVVSDDQLADIPKDIVVKRAFALDCAKHLAIAGRYSKLLATPDRWISWWAGGVISGTALIRKYRPEVIWSTYPIATAHVLASTLSRMTAIPWIADFRDPMTEAEHPQDPTIRRWFQRIERLTMQRCAKAVFTTPGAIRMYQDRYPSIPKERFALIENGYDEGSFAAVGAAPQALANSERRLKLLHSGVIYPAERNPTHFFAALAELKESGRVHADTVHVLLRAPGHESFLSDLVAKFRIEDLVELAPAIPYRDALAEMLEADGLLVLQGANCNHQIPAKVYEYLRAGRPILGLTDPAGDTAGVLREAGVITLAPLESKDEMVTQFARFVALLTRGEAPVPREAAVRMHSRQKRSMLLAQALDSVCRDNETPLQRSIAR